MSTTPSPPKTVIVGLDEAGRGPLAGPVVAAACHLDPTTSNMPCIADSKQLSSEQREEAYTWITSHCPHGIGIVESKVIDAHGILEATQRAMHAALAELKKIIQPTYLLIDGRDKFWFDYPNSKVIKGDELEPCIAAASILAKVTRDRLMVKAANTFPQYGFQSHKGYGTPEHLTAIRKYGLSSFHRRTFCKKARDPQAKSPMSKTARG